MTTLNGSFHFSKYLEKGHIDKVKDEFTFREPTDIERFIMDYEMLYHIKDEFPCTVKGGMAVPFHLPDKKARRLSIDIDLVTPKTADEVSVALAKIQDKTADLVAIEPHIPKEPVYNLPMLTYFVTFKSCYTGVDDTVKIDIYYEFNEKVFSTRVPASYDLFALQTDYEFEIFGTGSLIGDKLTTLGFNTIGIDPKGRRAVEISKHIYDIGRLVRISTTEALKQSAEVFRSISAYEASIRNIQELPIDEIVNDIMKSLDSLVPFNDKGFMLSSSQDNRFKVFRNQLFFATEYQAINHRADILIVKLLCSYLKLVFAGQISSSQFAEKCHEDIKRLNIIEMGNRKEIRAIREEVIAPFLTLPVNSILKRLTTEELFLYSRIDVNAVR